MGVDDNGGIGSIGNRNPRRHMWARGGGNFSISFLVTYSQILGLFSAPSSPRTANPMPTYARWYRQSSRGQAGRRENVWSSLDNKKLGKDGTMSAARVKHIIV